jgi:putative transposase
MARKKFEAGQIIGHLRAIEIFIGKGKTAAEACREVGITEQTYYRWRKEYGGMQVSQAKSLKPSDLKILRKKTLD